MLWSSNLLLTITQCVSVLLLIISYINYNWFRFSPNPLLDQRQLRSQLTPPRWRNSYPRPGTQLVIATDQLAIANEELQLIRQLVQLLNRSTSSETVVDGRADSVDDHRPRDCAEIKREGFHKSGKYVVYPEDGEGFPVYCDMTTSGGGWTVSLYHYGIISLFIHKTSKGNVFNLVRCTRLPSDRSLKCDRMKCYVTSTK